MTVQGIDVSNWQGEFDWAAWRGRIGFGMAKATEGEDGTDAFFGHNWDSMWHLQPDHRLPRFAYCFFHAAQDPVVQAAHLVATVRQHGLLPGDHFTADFEATDDTGLNDGVPPAEFARRGVTFLEHVNALAPGHRVLPYLSPSFAAAGNAAGMGRWYLWLASYTTGTPAVPEPWHQWTFWQNSPAPVDLDQYNGTPEQLLAFTRMPDRRLRPRGPVLVGALALSELAHQRDRGSGCHRGRSWSAVAVRHPPAVRDLLQPALDRRACPGNTPLVDHRIHCRIVQPSRP